MQPSFPKSSMAQTLGEEETLETLYYYFLGYIFSFFLISWL